MFKFLRRSYTATSILPRSSFGQFSAYKRNASVGRRRDGALQSLRVFHNDRADEHRRVVGVDRSLQHRVAVTALRHIIVRRKAIGSVFVDRFSADCHTADFAVAVRVIGYRVADLF